MSKRNTVTMYRPVGPGEFELLKQRQFLTWPPRLPEQPIFYPVTNLEYAIEITRKWNVRDFGVGYVTRFEVSQDFADRYEVHQVGDRHHTEWWIPSENLGELNRNIVGVIEVTHTFTTISD